MTTTTLMPSPRQRFYDNNGRPLASGKLYTYAAGTSTPKDAYTDSAGLVPHTNPIILDAHGEATVYWSGNYKIDLRTAAGVQVTGYPVDNFKTDPGGVWSIFTTLLTGAGASLIGFIQDAAGAVLRTVQGRLRDTVHVTDFGSDDSGAASATNVTAFANAAALGATVIVPKPAISYYLASDPVIPANVNIAASPDWFSGPGKLPMHAFVTLSEGVDPRIFSVQDMVYSETTANETKRKWGVVGWVNYKNAPATGFEGTLTDAVGVDGRGVTSVANGRVWGLLGLAQMDAGVAGVAQAYGAEIDVNQNNANNAAFDGTLPAKGLVIASGGTYRPEGAIVVLATKTPTNTLGDNRFFAGIRFYRDSCKNYLIHVDDANTAFFSRIPPGCVTKHTYQETIDFVQYMDVASHRYIMWSQTAGYGLDIVGTGAAVIFSTYDNRATFGKPMGRSSVTQALPAQIDASQGDVFVISSAGNIPNGITGGVDRQRITVINASGGAITLSRNANMRTAGGAAVTINALCTAEFYFISPTYYQIGPTNNA